MIVDANTRVRRGLAREFSRHRYHVTHTAHGTEALTAAKTDTPDLVITALDLPDIDGFTFIRNLRDSTVVPIIATTSAADTQTTVKALVTGADDVLVWPFTTVELLARSGALLRRAGRMARNVQHTNGDVTFDFALRHASQNGATLRFTALEWRCLETFVSAPNRLFTHHELITSIWGVPDAAAHRDALRALIRRVRRTLNDNAHTPTFIQTHPGVGYCWLTETSDR